MQHTLRRVTPETMGNIQAVAAEMQEIQDQIDPLMVEIQEATKVVDAIRAKVKPLRALLVPLAEKRSRIARGE